jgi:hypothetical protein
MVLCPPFPNKEQDTGPIILVIIILQKIRYTAQRYGPELWNYAQEVRRSLLDDLTKARLDLHE